MQVMERVRSTTEPAGRKQGVLQLLYTIQAAHIGREELDRVVDAIERLYNEEKHASNKEIPLTDEILHDWCGFMPAKRCEGLTKHGIDLVPAGNSYYDNKTGREITTLHQLQNYVYAVSGNELDVKLPTQQP